MRDSIFLSLLQNTAILLSFSFLYEHLWLKKKDSISLIDQLLCGFLIGGIGIVLMLSSWELAPGIVFDTRSVILSITGLFFGVIPTVVAMIIAGSYRLILGGEGVVMGVAVIISSGVIGILWNKIWAKMGTQLLWVELLLLGFVVHAVMLCCTLLLPQEKIIGTVSYLILPLLTIYPVGNMLLGMFMYKQQNNWENKNALNTSREKFSSLYEVLNDAFVVFDKHGSILEFNSAFQELIGYSENELFALSFADITTEKWDAQKIRKGYEEILIDGKPRVLEKICKHKDGTIIPIEIKAALQKDENGELISVWVVVRDISLRKEAMIQIENERTRLKTLLETMPEMIWLKDKDGAYISCNQNFADFNGIEEKDLIGKTDHEFYESDVADFYFQKDLDVMDKHQIVRFVSWAQSAQKDERILTETIKAPMFNSNNELIGVLGVSRDISEIKKAEEELKIAKERAEESDKLKSIFLANMSHEIRTPMNAILGFSELLVDSDIDDVERLQYVNIIQNSGNRLLQIIDDIVDISKLELNQITIKKSENNLFELFNRGMEIFREDPMLESKPDIDLVLNFPAEYKNVSLYTDANRFQQILDNLIGNAYKFANYGKIEVGFNLKEMGGKSYLEVYVSDEGIGIPKEQYGIIFDRFRQGDEEQFIDGTGLGLTICKGLVELMGGEIWFESEVDKGSTFYFTIPFTENSITNLKTPIDECSYGNFRERKSL